MKYRNLGRSGLKVSEIALGSWMTDVSDENHQQLAAESIHLAYENGVNFLIVRMLIVVVLRKDSWVIL